MSVSGVSHGKKTTESIARMGEKCRKKYEFNL